MRKTFATLAIAASLAAAPAAANDLHNDDWTFNFMNDSSLTVMQLTTLSTNGRWSQNWLRAPVQPGTGLTLQFYDRNDTRCEVRTYVRFSDESYYDEVLDYCDAALVIVRDDAIYTE